MMKVSELIDVLKAMNPEAVVVIQKDAEGNGYSPCVGAEEARYEADSTWSGDVLSVEDEDHETRGVPCVVMWPVN